MARTMPVLATLAALAAPPTHAADSWGLENERTLEVTGKVVDLLCALAGDCPAGCGAGKRQLGILTAEGRLLPAVKGTVFFAGVGSRPATLLWADGARRRAADRKSGDDPLFRPVPESRAGRRLGAD